MYAGGTGVGDNPGGDNPGKTEQEIVHACFEACRTKKTPEDKKKSWATFGVVKGFIVDPKGQQAGRCYCESADSSKCSPSSGQYDRYDFKSPGPCNVGFAQRTAVRPSMTVCTFHACVALRCVACYAGIAPDSLKFTARWYKISPTCNTIVQRVQKNSLGFVTRSARCVPESHVI